MVLARLGMTKKDTLFLRFSRAFWPEKCGIMNCPASPFTFRNLVPTGTPGTLQAIAKHWYVDEFESASPDHVVAVACGVIRKLFPDGYDPPVAVKHVAWGNNPLQYGSYAYYKLVARKADNVLLSLPLSSDDRATKT